MKTISVIILILGLLIAGAIAFDNKGYQPFLQNYQATPADPATTTSLTPVMMGLAGAFTPIKSGKILIVISGDIDNNTLGDGSLVQLRYGTGTAPTNAAALTGTAVGGIVRFLNPSLALLTPGISPVSCNAIVSGLTLNTAIWADISLGSVTGGTSRARDISICIIEL